MRPGQLQDIRDLIAADVDAIVFNPNDPDALNPALDEAKAAGIKTVSVDAYVTNPDTYNLYNNQVEYAKLGAKWLFEQLGGEGKVWYTRGIAGHPADTDRHTGFKEVLAELSRASRSSRPRRRPHRLGSGDRPPSSPTTSSRAASTTTSQGIWTSGMDSQVVDAIKAAGQGVRADRRRRPRRVRRPAPRPRTGLEGAAVTNTAAVGGAGVNLALKLLNGETVETDADGTAAEHGPAQAGPGRQRRATRARPSSSRGRSTGSTRSGRSAAPIEGFTDVHPRAGRRLQGPGRVAAPAIVPVTGGGRRHRRRLPLRPRILTRADDRHRDGTAARGDRRSPRRTARSSRCKSRRWPFARARSTR